MSKYIQKLQNVIHDIQERSDVFIYKEVDYGIWSYCFRGLEGPIATQAGDIREEVL